MAWNVDEIYLYCIVPPARESPCKIGISGHPFKRVTALSKGWELYEIAWCCLIGHWDDALRIEKAMHNCFSEKRIRNEWFATTPAMVYEALELYLACEEERGN